MKRFNFLKTISLLSFVTLLLYGAIGCAPQKGGSSQHGPDIYDRHADGEKLIADALVVAKRENKHVIAEFGANWCIWCRRMHSLLHSNEVVAPYFEKNFLLVMIDVDEVNGKTHNETVINRYGDPTTNGIPGLVMLDADGKVLKVQTTEGFENGDVYNPEKVLEFLKEYAPRPANN
jgi:thiol-disulfide isomerase/thioredoxin